MRRIVGLIVGVMTFLCLNMSTAYAKEYNFDGIRIQVKDDSVLLPDGIEYSKDEVHDPKRGSIISFAIASVDNVGNGDMAFEIDTYAHVACDEIRHKAFVDVWDEDAKAWYTIDTVLFVAKQEMVPDEPLISLNNSFTVKDLKVGSYYRISGAHMVKLNGETETLSTCTDGIKNELH